MNTRQRIALTTTTLFLVLAAGASGTVIDPDEQFLTIRVDPCPEGQELVKRDIDNDGDLEEVCEDVEDESGSVGWDEVNSTVNGATGGGAGAGHKVADISMVGDAMACTLCQLGNTADSGTIWITVKITPDGSANYTLSKVNGGRDPVDLGDDLWLVHFPAGKNHGDLVFEIFDVAPDAEESRFAMQIQPDSQADNPTQPAYTPRAFSSNVVISHVHETSTWKMGIDPSPF